MLERFKEELTKMNTIHEDLVKKYDDKSEEIKKANIELANLEKEIIHNQGGMKAINDLGVELMEKQEAEAMPTENVEVVTE